MKNDLCPFCNIELETNAFFQKVFIIDNRKRFDCDNDNCASAFCVAYHNDQLETWSFRIKDILIFNSITENYCFISKFDPLYFPSVYETLLECDAWDENPFDVKSCMKKIQFCLTFI